MEGLQIKRKQMQTVKIALHGLKKIVDRQTDRGRIDRQTKKVILHLTNRYLLI